MRDISLDVLSVDRDAVVRLVPFIMRDLRATLVSDARHERSTREQRHADRARELCDHIVKWLREVPLETGTTLEGRLFVYL